MKPVQFPGANKVWAEDQPPYLPLPAYTDHKAIISCWRLTWQERLKLLWSGRLWLHQWNFSQKLQPIAPSVDCPFTYSKT